jgi:superfamily II DNA/RNA helicase
LQNDKRAGTVGFALTTLQRRLASSPEAIYQSLHRRRERLESRLRELELLSRAGQAAVPASMQVALSAEELEDLEDAPENEVQTAEQEILDQATAATSIAELRMEIETLTTLEAQAFAVRRSGTDTKWTELSSLLSGIFTPVGLDTPNAVQEPAAPYGAGEIPPPKPSPHQKLVVFTEHRDTLNYLLDRITGFLGRKDSVVVIHGGTGREDRLKVQESFKHDPTVQVLLATDAAGEGINLQRAHLMVNYDLPWNPNRLEQRFGRIHRIGQTETCHLWNLVADETREGDVYRKLLEKLELARRALGGQVFDVLGKLAFEADGKVMTLRDLLIQAIRFGELPETKAYLSTVLESALDKSHFQSLLDERQLVRDSMDARAVQRIREDMERAEARRLQPHYIESFFLEAFKRLGGFANQKESRRFEVTHVPALVRNRDRLIGIGEPVLPRYERIAFEKNLVSVQGRPLAAFVCPGHPLLDAVIDLTLERNRDLLKRGAVLVDERDPGTQPKVLFYLEHAIQDASINRDGTRHVVSKRMMYVEMDEAGATRHVHYAPYLDFRPLREGEPGVDALLGRPECQWITRELEMQAQTHAISRVVPEHLAEVKGRKLDLISKTEAAVKDRLTKEINYWDHRAEALKLQEQAGKPNARLNSGEARKRADLLQARLQKRLDDLRLEAQLSPLPPVVLGGVLVVPIGLLQKMGAVPAKPAVPIMSPGDNAASAARARAVIMQVERELGFEPVDCELEKLGYDIESRVPGTGRLRFIEVKGRVTGAATLTVTRNEILYSLNKPDDFILAIVEFIDEHNHKVHYLRQPFSREPDFDAHSVNYDFAELLARAGAPS